MKILSCACSACRAARKTSAGKREVSARKRAARRKVRQDLRSGRVPDSVISAGYAG